MPMCLKQGMAPFLHFHLCFCVYSLCRSNENRKKEGRESPHYSPNETHFQPEFPSDRKWKSDDLTETFVFVHESLYRLNFCYRIMSIFGVEWLASHWWWILLLLYARAHKVGELQKIRLMWLRVGKWAMTDFDVYCCFRSILRDFFFNIFFRRLFVRNIFYLCTWFITIR